MTVQELMEKIAAAYRGFDSDAVDAMAPVFKQKLERFEGKELATAWVEVAAGFDAKPNKPYPLPKDFEAVLPVPRRVHGGGPALDLEGHAERKGRLVNEWRERQKSGIAEKWGPRVAFWADSEVRERAHDLAWRDDVQGILLSAGDLEKILAQVCSRDRMATFDAGVLDNRAFHDAWRDQMARCREHVLAGRHTYDETPQAVRKDRPKRSGPVFDAPVVEIGEPPPWIDAGPPIDAGAEPE